jgi:hypothetical protein
MEDSTMFPIQLALALEPEPSDEDLEELLRRHDGAIACPSCGLDWHRVCYAGSLSDEDIESWGTDDDRA